MNRRVICLILMLALSFSMIGSTCIGAAEESDESPEMIPFDANFTNAMDQEAKVWMTNDDSRALVTLSLILDLASAADQEMFSGSMSKASYVGKAGLDLCVYIHGAEDDIMIVYRPINGDASYAQFKYNSDDVVTTVLEKACYDGYYKNDMESIYKVAAALQEATSGND